MKTLIFPSEFSDNNGGVPQSMISVVNGLKNCVDFKVVVVCPRDSEMSTTSFSDNVVVQTTKSSTWTMSKRSIFQTLKTIIDLFLTIRQFLGKDTWVITNQPVTSSLISLLPCKHIKEVYINRGGDFQDGGIASLIMLRKLKTRCIEYVVGISKRQFDLLVNCGMPECRVCLIHNGLPLPSVCYEYKELSKDSLRISTMGFISNLKNQIEGIKLVKMLRDVGINAILNIYGEPDSDKEYQIKIHDVIKNLNIAPYIKFHGFISGEKLYSETDVLISFSRSEGFGRSLVEGMLRKKPIIAWRGAGGPIDITCNGMYGHLVEKNEASEYFNVLYTLLNDPVLNKKNVEDAYRFACQYFTIESMAANYVKFFKYICKQ